jgi:hypothetical protein
MKTDTERVQVEYNDRASRIFFLLLQEFETNSLSVNRETHEHDFQRLKRTYANRLNQDLQTIAEGILNDHRYAQSIKYIDLLLNQLSRQYMHRFVQKIDAY